MAGRVAGKVALITGAGRGQGRAHALRLAEEGASIIAVDICRDYGTMPYPMATATDLDATAAQVRAIGGQIVATPADVRDAAELDRAVRDGINEFGRLDIVCANAGICSIQTWDAVTPQLWNDTLETNVTGVWNTFVSAIPHLIEAGGGSMIATSSTGGLKGLPFETPYVAAKHAVVGIARSLANELASHHIRVNSLHPTGVDTPMAHACMGPLAQFIEERPDVNGIWSNSLPARLVEVSDISNAVVFLASDESRYVTGACIPVDAGNTSR